MTHENSCSDSGAGPSKAWPCWKLIFAGFVIVALGCRVWLAVRPDVTVFPPTPEFLAAKSRAREPKPVNDGPALTLSLERTEVSVTNLMSTLIGFRRTSEPPWEYGNYLTFQFRKPELRDGLEEHASWHAVNIHAENFYQITKRLNLSSVEVRVLHRQLNKGKMVSEPNNTEREFFTDDGYAIVADPRIPREWFLGEPGACTSAESHMDRKTRAILLAAYPEFFRKKN